MNWTATNSKDVKHHITMSTGNEVIVTIIRLRVCGGIPRTIVRHYNKAITFGECMTKINTVLNLDEEIYDMVVDSMK